MKICAHVLSNEQVDSIVYVESGNCGLSVTRLRQLGLNQSTLSRIKHARCHNFQDLFHILQSTQEIIDTRTLVILDCLTPLIWASFGDQTSNDLLKQLQIFIEQLSKQSCIILTNNSIRDMDRQTYKRALGKKLNVANVIVQVSRVKASSEPPDDELESETLATTTQFKIVS